MRRDAEAAGVPLPIRRPGEAGLGVLVLAIACLWLAAALRGVLAGEPAIVPGLGAAGAYWAGAGGVGLAVLSLHWIVRRRTVALDRGTLIVAERSLLGRHTWSEPLANYRGIRRGHEQWPHRYGLRRRYLVQLWHPEPAKTVELTRAGEPAAVQARAREYARRFDLPLLRSDHEATGVDRIDCRDQRARTVALGEPLPAR